MKELKFTTQDFTFLKTLVKEAQKNNEIQDEVNAFYYVVLNLLFSLQDDEIEDCITDNHFLKMETEKKAGHDRAIDAIYIEQDTGKDPTIHILNFKYTKKFDKTKNNFPGGDIAEIVHYFTALMNDNIEELGEANASLIEKTQEILSLIKEVRVNYKIYLCSNYGEGLSCAEKEYFEKSMNKYSNWEIVEFSGVEMIKRLGAKNKVQINAKIKGVNRNVFKKSEGDISAVIINIDALDALRMVSTDAKIRDDVSKNILDIPDYEFEERAFEENVRISKGATNAINKGIIETALSEERYKFYYYNNGLTIICDKVEYPPEQTNPIIEIENLQIVNGSQTMHSLYEAYKREPQKIVDISLLGRIYETSNKDVGRKIAEFTNSQTKVATRDIRSLDDIQRKLEQELKIKGYYYERKKDYYKNDVTKQKRIDSEKAGQVILAFYLEEPQEAKNKKSVIFGKKYDEIFDNEINAEKVLLPYILFNYIEDRRKQWIKETEERTEKYSSEYFIKYASYYILYILGKMGPSDGKTLNRVDSYKKGYMIAFELMKELTENKRNHLKKMNEDFDVPTFYNRDSKIKKEIKELLDEKLVQKKEEIESFFIKNN